MSKYRKKPVVIEARQWDGSALNAGPIIDWILATGGTARYHGPGIADPGCTTSEYHETHHYCPGCGFTDEPVELHIDTLEGVMHASPDDFIIQGVQGEFYPCKPDIFESTYEAVEATE